MAITELQRAKRAGGVGASECAAILGFDPWRTPFGLWAIKSGKIEVSDDDETEAMELGNDLEPAIARQAEKRLGRRLVCPTGTYKHANGVMFANLDRQLVKAERGSDNCELKSTSILDGWGEEGTDQIPERTLVQVTAQMACSDARVSHVARLIGRFGFRVSMFVVEYNEKLAAAIEERVLAFFDLVRRGSPPPDSAPSLAEVSSFRRTAGTVVDVGPEVVRAFVLAREQRKAAQEREDAAKVDLLRAMGEADGARAPGFAVSFREVSSSRLDVATLRSSYPDAAEACMKTSTYRRLDVREVAP